MNIISIKFDDFFIISFQLNWLLILAVGAGVLLITGLMKCIIKKFFKKSITVDEVTLGIGDSSIKLKYDRRDQEIAYKLWVELNTREIGMPFNEEDDVISEVYDSWYEFFKISRELLKDIPANRIRCSSELIQLTTTMLNEGLRPHLTMWQAKYRRWYSNALEEGKEKSPQETQREYPSYDGLIDDLKATNQRMVSYGGLLHEIAFEN